MTKTDNKTYVDKTYRPFEIISNQYGVVHVNLKAKNGKILSSSEVFRRRKDAISNIIAQINQIKNMECKELPNPDYK